MLEYRKVLLTPQEVAEATEIGADRYSESRATGLVDQEVTDGEILGPWHGDMDRGLRGVPAHWVPQTALQPLPDPETP